MKVLVTGGGGFIGSHVAEAYRDAGHQVVVVDALIGGRQNNAPTGVTFYCVDIRQRDLEDVFRQERPDVVSHHAAQANVRHSLADPVRDAEHNVHGTLRVLECSRLNNVRQIIFSSTAGALYGEPERLPVTEDDPIRPTSPYGFHKYLAEQYFDYYRRNYGLNTTIFRYGNVYGPRQDPQTEAGVIAIFTEQFLTGRMPVVFGDGRQVRDFVYVADVADANLRALGQEVDVPLHIGSGVGTSVLDLAGRLRTMTEAPIPWTHGAAVPGEVGRIVLSVERAARVLNWRPKVSLEQGLRRTVGWFVAKRQGDRDP